MKKTLLAAAAAVCMCVPGLALAEATVTPSATTGSTAAAHVDVAVVVPAVLYLRVGPGSALNTNNATGDKLTFTVPAANVGNGAVVAAGVTDGDLGNGARTVRVYSNVGADVKLESAVAGPLKSATGQTIPWTQISEAAAALASGATSGFTNAAIAHPPFNATAGGGATATPTTLVAVNSLVMYEGQRTYSYANSTQVPSGTYGNTVANNGRITY